MSQTQRSWRDGISINENRSRSQHRGDADGDKVPIAGHQKQKKQRNQSKNKIPKNVRFELEKSLVSLCDVWFEDIKPYLIRNNIKLHANSGEKANVACASGDYGCKPNVTPTPNCTHKHPGAASDILRHKTATYADYCSTQPTALKAPYLKPQVSSHHPYYPQSPTLTLAHERAQSKNQDNNHKERQDFRKRKAKPGSLSTWKFQQPYPITNISKSPPLENLYLSTTHSYVTRASDTLTASKASQTARKWFKSVGIQAGNPMIPARPCRKRRRRHSGCGLPLDDIYRPKVYKDSSEEQYVFVNENRIYKEKNRKRIIELYSSPAKVEYSSITNLVSFQKRTTKKPPWR